MYNHLRFVRKSGCNLIMRCGNECITPYTPYMDTVIEATQLG